MSDGHYSRGPAPEEPDAGWPGASEDLVGDAPIAEGVSPFPHPSEQDIDVDVVAERKKMRAERRRLLWKSPGFIIGVVIVVLWIVCGLWPGLIAPWGENEVVRLADGSTIPRQGPSSDAWFGTDSRR